MIHISIDADTAEQALHQMRAFLGGSAVGDARTSVDDRQAEMFPVRPSTTAEPLPEVTEIKAEKPKRTRAAKVTDVVEQTLAISTGEERIEPQTTTDDKPTEPVKIEKKLLTVDDVRAAAKPYIDKFGMPAASSDLTPCLVAATGVSAISQLADKDQETLQKAIDAFMVAGAAAGRYGAVA